MIGKNQKVIILLVLLFVTVIVVFLNMFVFNVYESKLILEPNKKHYYINDEIKLKVIELNGLGKQVPFSKNKNFELKITDGESNIEIVDSSYIKIITLKKVGIVKLNITASNSLMPFYKEINIIQEEL